MQAHTIVFQSISLFQYKQEKVIVCHKQLNKCIDEDIHFVTGATRKDTYQLSRAFGKLFNGRGIRFFYSNN